MRVAIGVVAFSLVSLSLVLAPGCGATVVPNADSGGNGNANRNSAGSNANRNSNSTAGDNEVRIVLRNLSSDSAVNVQLHATNNMLASLPADLFVDANRVTASIGLAGSSLLAPGQMDTIFFECTENLVVGTQGGAFLDAESGAMTGQGPQRYAVEGPQFSCGATVIYTFDDDGDGFTVTQSIQ